MSHLYSTSKGGDQLCPLGFHPQVRWPTRCKRCFRYALTIIFNELKFKKFYFRDYKEHGARRGDDIAASTPSLNRDAFDKSVRSWTSTSNLTQAENVIEVTAPLRIRQRPSSWSSTPDLEDKTPKPPPRNEDIVVNIQIPVRRRPQPQISQDNVVEESFTLKRPPAVPPQISSLPPKPPQNNSVEENVIISKTDSLAERVRKMQMMKRQGSLERDSSSREGSVTRR
jgi:hypothetical protein